MTDPFTASPVPNGPLTPGRPMYGPAPHSYGEPPAPTYGPIPAPPADPRSATSRAITPRPIGHANWGRRVPAFLIDFAPALLACVPLTVAYFGLLFALLRAPISRDSTMPDLGFALVWLLVGAVLMLAAVGWNTYNRWLVGGRSGQSLGKRVMKLRLLSEQTGQPVGPSNAFARDLAHILDGISVVGFLWPLWDDNRQTFADMLLHTVVTDDRLTA